MTLKTVLFAAMLGFTPMTIASAHAPHIGPHGGPQTDAGSFHIEIVTKDTALDVYLADHSAKDVASDGFNGLAILVSDGKAVRVTLTPAGGNKLTGKAESPLNDPKGVVQITTPTGSKVQGKFE